jgi:exopolysaccharide biosynthesis operon protein EpsL
MVRRRQLRGFGAAIIVAGVLVPVTDAVALWDDKLEAFVSQTVTRDDNVFRLSSGLDPAAVLGSSSKGDTYSTTSLGFNLDVPLSRQRLQGGVTLNKTRYDRFTVLNGDGHQGQGIWLWQIGNDISGQLGYTETFGLASLANIQSNVQSSTPNFLTTRRAFVNAAYLLTPSWRLRGEAGRLKQSNEIPERKVNDTSTDTVDLTVSYVTPVSNQIGLGMRVEDGRLPNQQLVAGELFDNSYRQQNVAAVIDWTLTGSSHVNARVGSVRRRYAQLPQRDFAGPTFQATYDWKPTGNLTLTAAAQNGISATEQINIGFVLIKGVALRPTLRLTDKVNLAGAFEYSNRDYRSDPALVLGIVPNRTDRVRSAAMTVSYRPVRTVTLQMALLHETRSSTFAFGDYAANVVSVSARLGF